jgi:5-formyltetrahydrofolate cyclo-ligase
MDEMKEKKNAIRSEMIKTITGIPESVRAERYKKIEEQLFEFANYMESKIPLLYIHQAFEVPTERIIQHSLRLYKIVVLPAFNREKRTAALYKVDDLEKDLIQGPRGVLEPNPDRCKKVPLDRVDIAIIPGVVFDEKGGRVGSGQGYYDRLMPRLTSITRKVSLCLEDQMVAQAPMESHDKYVDIIVTDTRIIYKI